ncbi:hypothetical protein F5B18DRAFT_656442 [Nemania serpens]|nr:hypothetical protein F5B18DRAFT_656442 [Nemania serpens]
MEARKELTFGRNIEPPTPEDTFNETPAVRLAVKEYVSKNAVADLRVELPACLAPLISVGAGVGREASSSLENEIEALGVRAEIILPETAKEYAIQVLKHLKLKEHVAQNWIHEPPFYLIVGVAICKGLKRKTTVSEDHSLSAHANASVEPLGTAGSASIGAGREAGAEVEVEVEEECAFAYRVREFEYSKRAVKIKRSRDHKGGAMFGNDGGGQQVMQNNYDVKLTFAGFKEDEENLGPNRLVAPPT